MKFERLHRVAGRAIFGCFSFSPISLLLCETSLPPLRDTLTHLVLSSYKRTLRLQTPLSISGLDRLRVKLRPCRSSWRAFASTQPLMLPSTSPREGLSAYPPSLSCNLLFFTMDLTLSSPCSCSDPPLAHQGAALAHLGSLFSRPGNQD